MRFSFWPGAGNTWDETVEVCRHAEATGWDGVWFADHFMPNTADAEGPTAEVFTTLAGLAALVPRVRLGTLVIGNTYRNPAVMAKMAAAVDLISGGRFILGLGAGWQENEHQKYGIEFSTPGGRLRRLEEAVQIVKGLLTKDRTTFEGRYYQVTDAPLEPKPAQQPLPILIGGGGEKKTMLIAARYADEWNVWGTPETMRHKNSVLNQHCETVGRDPKSIKRSTQALLFLGDGPEIEERARAAAPRPVIAGDVAKVRDIIGQYADAGVDELIVPDFSLGRGERRIETMDRFINDVAAGYR
jgi:F420-dependent oxidoreductase-like protein